jgi:cobalt/nickel transport system permease protein
VLAILAILVETTATTSLIGAIRKLGAPHSVNLVASLMLRYIAMLNEEFGRMSRARLARAGGPLSGVALFEVHGNQVGLLLIRSWERAERIHRAMLSRGFDGTMPDLNESRFAARDAIAATAVAGAFTGVRLALGGLGL